MKKKSGINFHFIFKTIGFLLCIEAICIFLSSLVSFYYKEECSKAIVYSSIITLLSGIIFSLLGRTHTYSLNIGKREACLVVTSGWIMMTFFGLLPYFISDEIKSFSSAFFETMSGFTATGATVLADVEHLPHGLLFWRSFTQWMGGIGIIVFALVILPMIGGNASVLYEAETTGIVREKIRPRVNEIAKRLFICYMVLTTILFVLLTLGPMGFFDSACHAMTTVSTGGFSTKNESIAYWNSAYIEYVIIAFMFLGGVNFSLTYFMLRGVFSKIRKDEEFRWYVWICIIFTVIIFICVLANGYYSSFEKAFRVSLFQVISMITTTAYSIADYVSWGTFYVFLFNLLIIFCACAGSTTGGMKIARLIVLVKNTINEFKLQVHPNAVIPVRMNGTVVSPGVVSKVLSFMFLYICIIFTSFIVLSLGGMNFEESIEISISSISNVGTGLGRFTETGAYSLASEFNKWYICLLMLVGRLEIFTVLSLFIPSFWHK